MEKKMDRRFQEIEKKMDRQFKEIDKLFEEVENALINA